MWWGGGGWSEIGGVMMVRGGVVDGRGGELACVLRA